MLLAIDFDDKCARAGLDVLIYCTRRSFEEQARLYRNGRSFSQIVQKEKQLKELGRPDLANILIDVGPQYGKRKVTNAAPGQSYHNYGLAFDGCPLLDGKPVWDPQSDEENEMWQTYGQIAVDVGLEWAGNWKRFKEMPHCQLPGQDWRDLIQNHE